MEKYQNKYRSASARLQTWDYASEGMYFITICTKNRIPFFGYIENEMMNLNEIGKIAQRCWAEIPSHFYDVELGEYVIMPDHVHGIIIINNHKLSNGAGPVVVVGTGPDVVVGTGPDVVVGTGPDVVVGTGPDVVVGTGPDVVVGTGHALSLPNQPHFRFRNQGKNTISAMVGSFKSATTRLAKNRNQNFGWQTRFHDHIIRSHNEFIRISKYIRDNPVNWQKDRLIK